MSYVKGANSSDEEEELGITKLKKLLRFTDGPIEDIAVSCGI